MLNNILLSNFNTSLQLLGEFQVNMRTKLFGTMRGSHNATELVQILPFWLNSEESCVESNSRIKLHLNQTIECTLCSPVQWENTLTREFLGNGRLENVTKFGH